MNAPDFFWAEDWPAPRHDGRCPVLRTHFEPCNCGAQEEWEDPRNAVFPLPEPGSTAARLDAIHAEPVDLDCDGDQIGGDAA